MGKSILNFNLNHVLKLQIFFTL